MFPLQRIPFIKRYRWTAAAVFLHLAGSITYWLVLNNKSLKQPASTGIAARHYKGDAAPGHNGAKLKLSNGRVIIVDTAKDGLIAMDGKVVIYKKDGRILSKGTNDVIVYNEIETDNGRQWSATLPDGSLAWLNAMSTLRYPLKFSGKERLVALTGECKFKVIHNEKMPFHIEVAVQVVEDIGTEFNINAYTEHSKQDYPDKKRTNNSDTFRDLYQYWFFLYKFPH